MIYKVKRFSSTNNAYIGLGIGIGGLAGALIGDKIEDKIIRLKASKTYSLDKVLKNLEEEKRDLELSLKDKLILNNPNMFKETKICLEIIKSTIKKAKADPNYSKEIWIIMESRNKTGIGKTIGGTIGSIGGLLSGHYINKKI